MTDSGAYGADMHGATTPGAHPGSDTNHSLTLNDER